MSERERFEAWARTQPRHEGANMRFLPLNNAYIDFDLHGAWLAWQAARSGQAASGSQENARSDVQNGVGQPEAPTAAPLGWKLVPTDPSNAMLLPIVRAFKCGHAEAWKVLSEAIAAHPPARSGAGSEETLRSALERITHNFRLMLAGKPVRDVSESLAEADAAMSQPDRSEES